MTSSLAQRIFDLCGEDGVLATVEQIQKFLPDTSIDDIQNAVFFGIKQGMLEAGVERRVAADGPRRYFINVRRNRS